MHWYHPKTLIAKAIITLPLSGNHQNHLPFIRLFAANGQLLVQMYQHMIPDCNIPLNKYPMHSDRQSKEGKVFCLGSQYVGRSGAQTATFHLCVLRCSTRPLYMSSNIVIVQ